MAGESKQTRARVDEPWTVRRIIDATTQFLKKNGSETPRLDAEILLAHTRNCRRIELYTRYEEILSDAERAQMRELVRRRAQAEPVAYLVGHREFFSLDFLVTPDVLIPRPDTETLVVELLELIKSHPAPRVLDVGTGSGCIAVAAAVQQPSAQVLAIDRDEAALEVARRNAERHSVAGRIDFLRSDLFQALPEDALFDAVVSNPPYIAESEFGSLQPDVRLHEPPEALVAGADGLEVIRRLIAESPRYLRPGAWLLIEIAPEQATAVGDLLAAGPFEPVRLVRDLAGAHRVAVARRL